MATLWEQQYKEKLCSAAEAVSTVQSGDAIVYCPFYTKTPDLDKALAERGPELHDVRLEYTALTYIPEPMKFDRNDEHFLHCDMSFSALSRQLVAEGYSLHSKPLLYHEVGLWHAVGFRNYDYIFVGATPMDKNGYFNLSCSNSNQLDHIRAQGGTKRNLKILVEVNPLLPKVNGDNYIHISDVYKVVETSNPQPLGHLEPDYGDEVDEQIAKLIINEIHDGCCLQLGIGGLPNQIGKMIAESDLKDLGCHTEMLVDAYLGMFNKGQLTNSKKQIHRGYSIFTFAMGSQELYDFMEDNPGLISMPASYTNNPEIIAQNDNMISVNSCINVDLFGNISSESVGYKQVSSTGGQFDFHFSSLKSKGGKGFICLHSSHKDKDGKIVSNIVPTFKPGTQISIPANITNYVVTEYGIVNLKGAPMYERVEKLASICHPDCREDFLKAADNAGLLTRSNKR